MTAMHVCSPHFCGTFWSFCLVLSTSVRLLCFSWWVAVQFVQEIARSSLRVRKLVRLLRDLSLWALIRLQKLSHLVSLKSGLLVFCDRTNPAQNSYRYLVFWLSRSGELGASVSLMKTQCQTFNLNSADYWLPRTHLTSNSKNEPCSRLPVKLQCLQ